VRRWRIPGWLTAVAAALVVAALVWFGHVGVVAHDLARLSLPALLWALAVVTCGYALRFVKWHLLAQRLGLRLGAARSVQVFLGGLMMVVTPAKLGDLWKSVLLTQDGITVARSLPAVGLERVLDFAAVCLIAGCGLILVLGQPWLLVLVLAFFGGLLLALHTDALWAWAERQMRRVARLRPAAHWVETVHQGAKALLHPRVLVPAFLLAVVAWTLEGIALALLLEGLGVHVPTAVAVSAFCIGTVAGVASFLPGGLGPTEAGMVALLVAHGVPSGTAVTATLLARACTLGYGSLLGAVITLLWRKPVTDLPPAQDGGVMDAQRPGDTLEPAFDAPQEP